MAMEFKLPELGESISSGTVVNIPVAVGDKVTRDQAVLEVETDKAIAEVPADFEGVIKEIHVKEGDEISPGQPILSYEAAGAAAPAETSGAGESAGDAADVAPDVRVAATDTREAAADTQEAATETAPPETAVASGPDRQRTQAQPEDDEAGRIAAGARSMADAPPAGITQAPHAMPALDAISPDAERSLLPAAPSTRRFAREIGIDIRQVPGSGPGGRISIEDVKAFAKKLNEGRAAAGPATAVPAVALPDFSRWGDVERRPMSGIRRATAENLSQTWATVPQVTQFDKADVTDLENLRKRYSPRVEAEGGKLTVTAILLKVVAGALKKFPQFNTSVDMAAREIIYKKYVHIGIAVDTEHGLMVPVIRDVDKKNIIELSVELGEIASKTRARKLKVDDMQGGCFTISNLGGIGGTGFTPIVNAPEVAILGVARTQIEAVYRDGTFVPRQMLPLALTYDHRVIDGADGIRFLRWIVEALENPFLLSLEG